LLRRNIIPFLDWYETRERGRGRENNNENENEIILSMTYFEELISAIDSAYKIYYISSKVGEFLFE
jgi:hypothetical protein